MTSSRKPSTAAKAQPKLIHLQDSGQLNVGTDDNGQLLLFCRRCKKIWVLQAEQVQAEADAGPKPGTVRCMGVGGMKLGGLPMNALGLDPKSIATLTSL